MARHRNGWIKVYRASILGDIGSSFLRQGLFDALIAFANIQSSTVSWNGKPRKLERGELVTSLIELAELGQCDPKTVSKHLNYLELRETIKIEKSPTGTFIKILNYEKYQGHDAEGSVQGPYGMDDGIPTAWIHNEELKNKRKKEYICKFDFDAFFEILKPIIKSEGPNARERFAKQITSQEKYEELITASKKYVQSLEIQSWRFPKTSVATFLGTERSGQFWRDFINLDLNELKKNTIPSKTSKNEVQEFWTNEAHNIFKNIKDFGPKSREVLGTERWEWINRVGGYDFVNRIKYDEFGVKKLADLLCNVNAQEVSA